MLLTSDERKNHPRKGTEQLVVTLVHGTWARNAEWTKDTAPLASALRRRLGDITIERFPWAGWNRFSSRSNGSRDLAAKLDSFGVGARHIIIAHSHGGNVAHDAVAGREDKVLGVICLNTPFFVALGRETDFILEIVVMYVGLFVMWLSFGLWASYGWHWGTAVGLFFAFGIVAGSSSDRLGAWVRRRGERVRQALTPPRVERTSILCFTTSEDEAFGVLGLLEALANLPFLLMNGALLPLAWSVSLFLLSTGALPVLSGPWELWTGATTVVGWPKWILFLGSSLFYPGLVFLAAFGAALVSSLVLATAAYGNWKFPDSNLFVRVMVSLVPVWSRSVEFEERPATGEGLRHSLLYENQETITALIDWLDTILAARAGTAR